MCRHLCTLDGAWVVVLYQLCSEIINVSLHLEADPFACFRVTMSLRKTFSPVILKIYAMAGITGLSAFAVQVAS